jgi:large subunit ribosomal protein L1
MKKQKRIAQIFDKNRKYTLESALNILKDVSSSKFEESVEVSLHFNVIPKKNIILKGFSVLKNNIGKKNKVAVFIDEHIDLEGCIVLTDEQLRNMNKKNIDFDAILTSPSAVVKLSKLTKLLNGRKIMPDIKYGTITTDIQVMLNNLNNNYLKFKIDKNYGVNLIVGKLNLTVFEIKENIEQLIQDIKRQKPQNCKSIGIKKIIISSTMGPGIKVDIDSINC